MRINRTNQILAGILLIQAILAIVVFYPREEETVTAGALLADYDSAVIDRVTISTDTDQTITLAKNEAGEWILPDYDDFPADALRVQALLDKFAALQANRVITRSDTSHRRLQVADDEYLRRIEFHAGDETNTLYLGNSGGGNAVHVRLNDDDDVYLVGGLTANDANGAVTSWINATYFTIPVTSVAEVTLENANGTFNFIKVNEEWVLSDLSGEETFSTDQFATLLNQVTNIRMSEPLSRTASEEWTMDAPQATITIRTEEVAAAPTPEVVAEATETVTEEATPQADSTAEAIAESTEEATPQADNTSEVIAEATAEPSPEPEVIEHVYTLQIGATLENGVVVKSSESDYYALINQVTADNFLTKTRENFLILPPTPTGN